MVQIRQGGDGQRWQVVRGTGLQGLGWVVRQASASSTGGAAGGIDWADVLGVLSAAFTLALGGRDSVAGRRSTVVAATRYGRLAARLWVDDVSGLLLRQEVLDGQGRLSRLFSFLDVSIDQLSVDKVHWPRSTAGRARVSGVTSEFGALARSGSGAAAAPVAGNQLSAIGQLRIAGPAEAAGSPAAVVRYTSADAERPSAHEPTGLVSAELGRLRRQGWPIPKGLPGGLELMDSRWCTDSSAAGAPRQVLHLTYTDGLSSISVFLEAGHLDADRLGAAYRSQNWGGTTVRVASGWPARVVWQADSRVATLVGDAPLDEVRAAVRAFPATGGAADASRSGVRALVHELASMLPGD